MAFVAILTVPCFSCGGGDGNGSPVLLGPFVITFEDRPDDGFIGKGAPIVLATGVTVTSLTPANAFYDFTSLDLWGLIGCDAIAISGAFMCGLDNGVMDAVGRITFTDPVAIVTVFASATTGTMVELEAFDATNASLGTVFVVSACPGIEPTDVLTIDPGAAPGQNPIVHIEIRGRSVAFDDLTFQRWN